MNRMIWVHGRFAWPLVIGIAYVAASWIVIDYFWRTVVLPFESFALYTVFFFGTGAALLAVLVAVTSQKSRKPR